MAPLAALLLRALAATWRVRFAGPDPFADDTTPLGGTWHRNLLVGAGVFRDRPLHVTVSRSGDGELAVALMRRLGLPEPPRGSSRSGAVGLLRSVVRLARGGATVVFPCDGPVGPARVAKPGVLQVARLAGTPVRPVALAARPCLRFRSWDRMLLPLPFARVLIRYGEPFVVPPGARGAELEALRAEFERRLDALTDETDRALGLPVAEER